MNSWFYIACAVFIFVYIVCPFILKFRQTRTLVTFRRPVEENDLTEIAREGIRKMVEELAPLGYEVASHTFQPTPVPNVSSGQILFINRTTHDTAQGIYTIAHRTGKKTWTFLFKTAYTSGHTIMTNSSRVASVFPRNPLTNSINLSWIFSPRRLHEIHRARVENLPAGELRPLPKPGEELEYLDTEAATEMQRVVNAGYYWVDTDAGLYRMTFKGAYLMCWRLLPPLKQIRLIARRAAAKRELRRLDIIKSKINEMAK